MNSLKKIKLRYWLIGSFALGVLMLLLAIRAQFVDVPLRVSPETTYVTSPLTVDGKSVDFFLALKQKYEDKAVIQSEKNGFRYLVQHLSNFKEESGDDYQTLCNELDQNLVNDQPRVRFLTFREFARDHVKSDEYDEVFFRQLADDIDADKSRWDDGTATLREDSDDLLFSRCLKPWTLEELPLMKNWVVTNQPAFDVISEAARKERFFIPMIRGGTDEATLEATYEPGLFFISKMGIGLIIRANLRIGSGDIDGAVDDLETCKRLGQHLENMPYYMPQNFGREVQGYCCMVGVNGSSKHVPTKLQLKQMSELHSSLQNHQSFEGLVYWGRLAFLQCMHEEVPPLKTTWNLNGEEEDKEKKRMLELGINWNLVARRVNQHFDALSKDIFNPPSIDESDDWTVWDTISIRHRSERLAKKLTSGIDLARKARTIHETQCQRQMHQITLAMLIYEKDHGTLPPAFTLDSNGNRLHSWRVLLLPYLGQNELYQNIRLDEPWDSVHNKKFWAHSLPIYQCPADKGTIRGDRGPKPGECNYTVIVGPESAFRGSIGVKLSEFRREPVDTILVTEVTAGFCWMDPNQDITQTTIESGANKRKAYRSHDFTGLSSNHHGVYFGLRDGSIQHFKTVFLNSVHEQVVPILRGTSSKSAFD